MWTENTLKHCVEAKLDTVFGHKVVVLDFDTYNTPVGRPDMVLLNESKQLIVVEFERVLNAGNIEHALIDQAWACAKYWYVMARHDDIFKMHEYYRRYRFPNLQEIPDVHQQLGFAPNETIWDRQRKLIVVAGAWQVDTCVYEQARMHIERILPSERNKMPCEVWVYQIAGSEDDQGNVCLTDCQRTCVFESESGDTKSEGPGLRTPQQHLPVRLSDEFRAMAEVLPDYLPYELKSDMQIYSKAKWRNQIVKVCPWGTESGICFEFSRLDSRNPIKGPHCSLYICQRRELGVRLREYLHAESSQIAKQLGCSVRDLAQYGYAYPIVQHRIEDTNPEAVAQAFGGFISVIYRHIDRIVRGVLDAR